jgi:hypothetical protein
MPHDQIRKSIDELNKEVKKAPVETGFLESTLEHAKEGLERYTPEALQELVQTLQNEAEQFEVEHPKITALINQVATSLSNLGI